MKIDCVEIYPAYVDDDHWGLEVLASDQDIARWKEAYRLWLATQVEMKAAYEAATKSRP